MEWVCDIDRTVRANPDLDWELLLKEAEMLGIKRMLYLGLELAHLLFALELPRIMHEEIMSDNEIPELIAKVIEVNFSSTTHTGKSYGSFGLLWQMRERLPDRLRFAWRALFAPKFDDYVFVQLPQPLTFLYPLVRPYRLMTKYFH